MDKHFVTGHVVRDYFRKNGTHVRGYFRGAHMAASPTDIVKAATGLGAVGLAGGLAALGQVALIGLGIMGIAGAVSAVTGVAEAIADLFESPRKKALREAAHRMALAEQEFRASKAKIGWGVFLFALCVLGLAGHWANFVALGAGIVGCILFMVGVAGYSQARESFESAQTAYEDLQRGYGR